MFGRRGFAWSIGFASAFAMLPILNVLGTANNPGKVKAGRDTDWATYNGSPDNLHYSSLRQINVDNVAQLEPVWNYDTHEKGGLETQPLIHPAVKTPWGTFNAINLDTGEYVWTIPFGEYPELVAQGLGTTGSENYGGPVVTAGGVAFIAATVVDKKIRAYDKRTGKLLWEYLLPYPGNATPAVYEVDGREYLVIASGGGRDPRIPTGGVCVAFALPQ